LTVADLPRFLYTAADLFIVAKVKNLNHIICVESVMQAYAKRYVIG